MCDYSLEMYASRPAREGEKYVTTRFPSGSIGLAVPGDCTTAVCMLEGQRYALENLSATTVRELENIDIHVPKGSFEGVFGYKPDTSEGDRVYRDGLFFNGRFISLQLLGSGVTVKLAEVPARREVVREREMVLETID